METPEEHSLALDNYPVIAQQIGIMMSAFAIIELIPPHILTKLTGLSSDEAETLLGQFKNISFRVDAVKALAKAKGDTGTIELLDGIKEAITLRNKYAHGLWTMVATPSGACMKLTTWLSDATKQSAAFWVTDESAKRDSARMRAILHKAAANFKIVVPEVQPKEPPPSTPQPPPG